MRSYLYCPIRLTNPANNLKFVKILHKVKGRYDDRLEVQTTEGVYIGFVDKKDLIAIDGKIKSGDKVAILRRLATQKTNAKLSGNIPQLVSTKLPEQERELKPVEPPRFSGKSRQKIREYSGENEALALREQKTRESRVKTRKQVNDKRPRPIGEDVVAENFNLSTF